jgi:zeaxanthin glucosyltransferase
MRLLLFKLKAAVQLVLNDQSYRDNAQKLCSAIQDAGGVQYAASIVEQVIQSGAPVVSGAFTKHNR